jgi:tetraacyldisaccharide 4'-kinase
LRGPVVSVGNLSTGGSGKTPFAILLGEELKRRNVPFDILSRGYGRTTRGVRLVDPAGTASDFGDEPLLLSRRLHAPVIVGESRFAAGLFAEKKFGPQLHVLDDGFQHRSLFRDFDIVLFSIADARDTLLPAGRLREPLASLNRADALVFTNSPGSRSALEGKLLWRVQRGIALENLPSSPVVFCGIARPESFLDQVRKAGVIAAAHRFFRDHHSYTESDVRRLLALQKRHTANGFLTTEKDLINLGPFADHIQPLSIARVAMEFSEPVDAVDTMLRIIAERRSRS